MSMHANGGAPETTPTENAFGAKVDDKVAEMWQRFDEKAERHVRELVESLSQQLDNLLLFAGLFSAINTALLVYTLPALSPSPQAQTNTLLYLLVLGQNNSTLSALGDAAVTNPSPTTSDVRVNALFTASLTCSLLASFGAVIGKQWLVYYSRSVYSSSEERRRELQRKIMGVDQWHLRGILEAGLSLALQVALLLFTVVLVIFLQTVNQTINTAITVVGLAALMSSMFLALRDDTCPYQTPLTISIIPRFFHFIIWWASAAIVSVVIVPLGLINLVACGCFVLQGRTSKGRAKLIGLWHLTGEIYGPSGRMARFAAELCRDIGRSLKRGIEGCELDAASLAWLLSNTRDTADYSIVLKAVPAINEREVLDHFAHSYATSRFLTFVKPKEFANPELAALITPYMHVYIATLDVVLDWASSVAKRLMQYRPAVENPQGLSESDTNSGSELTVPAPLYIAAALRSILDRRIYFKWMYNPDYRSSEWEEPDAKSRTIIMSCATPSAPPRVASMIALALKITTERELSRATPPEDIHRIQTADYHAVWSSYTSDEPFVKNLAGAILVYAKHRKAPPEEAAWPSKTQFTNLLLASHPYIEMEASAKQLDLEGLNLIGGCANLLASLNKPDEELQHEDMMEAARAIIDVTIKRIDALGEPSMDMLSAEAEMLNTLTRLYHGCHYRPIFDSIDHLLEHLQSNMFRKPSIQLSGIVIGAAGRVLMSLGSEANGYPAFVNKVTDLIDKVVDDALTSWKYGNVDAIWVSEPTVLAMTQYIKRLSDRGSVEESRKVFAATYAETVDLPRYAGLSDEQTRKKLREALKRLQGFVDKEDEIEPQTVSE